MAVCATQPLVREPKLQHFPTVTGLRSYVHTFRKDVPYHEYDQDGYYPDEYYDIVTFPNR